MIIETHVHLCDPRYDGDRVEMLVRARQAGVVKFLNIGAEAQECHRVAQFESEGVYKALGLHPHYVEQYNEEFFEKYCGYYRTQKNMAAVGEIGLDYFKSPVDRDVQERYFRIFLDFARQVNLPVVIHSRDAHADVYRLLKQYALPKKGIIHCFSGDTDAAEMFTGLGYALGVGGVMTFPNAAVLREAIKNTPPDKLVLETDAPWLAPQKYRGKRNEPAYLRPIAEALAELKGLSAAEVEEITTQNAERILNIR
ncbi:MAG: TatD family hydrolase [Spirochaetia bacterium]|nr:TatD family hydrolase [Spirochaetia bacterium]